MERIGGAAIITDTELSDGPECLNCGDPFFSSCTCSDPAVSVPILRWQCPCGRFVSESAISSEDYRDDSAYYGVSTCEWYDCSRCGRRDGSPWLVEIGHYTLKIAP